jgi:type I restriction enzyme S subunit
MAILLKEESRDSSKYLYYSLLHSDFSDVTTGSAQPQITMGHLNKKEIFWHSDPNERAQVAHILGTLDDKIELNRKTNETLEAIAKALFKSWFVDFDPVRAKAGGRPTGLPDEISDLFPDSFEDSELGEIPRGWEVGFLGDHTDLIKGRSYKSDELNQSTTALVTLKSFQRNGGYRSDGLKQFTGEYKEQQVVKPGELVVALTDVTQAADVIGRPAIVKSDSFCSKLVASLDVGIIRPRRDGRLATPYLYSLMLTPGYVQHVLGYTSGTTVLHLAKDATAKFPLPIPGASISNQYCLLAGSILHQIDASDRQSELLAKTRDALLPKLISGEIRIPDAERMLEEVCV